MESALRPRDIQARIRAGETLDEVARAAGVPAERIEVFASPVFAEREHVAGLAQANPVRRRGETTSHRTLRNSVVDALAHRGVEATDITWDAWKLEDRRWQVAATYTAASRQHQALFVYDQAGRFSLAGNDVARRLIGDEATASGLVDDPLAIVRAVQPADPDDAAPADADPEQRRPTPDDAGGSEDSEDAYREGRLTEVDGVYDIVESEAADGDVLYDMLSSFDEDSVRIYSGLVHPLGADQRRVVADPRDTTRDAPAEAEPPTDEREPVVVEGDTEPAEQTIGIRPIPPRRRPAASEPVDEPQQLSLLDDEPAPPPPPPQPPKKPARRRRASVPSWDEIMFGSPHQER